jgi:hypothetical protein
VAGSKLVSRALILLAFFLPWLLIVRETQHRQSIVERAQRKGVPVSRAEQSAWVKNICDRWRHLHEELLSAYQSGLTKNEVELCVGLPTIRTKEYFGMLQRGNRTSFGEYTSDESDEAWIYEILGTEVMVAIRFNTDGVINGIETTGIKNFLQDLPRDN